MVRVRTPRPRLSEETGIGLVEVMIAIFLLAVGLLAVASTAFASLRAMSDSQLRQQAMAMATESIEIARSYPFSQVAMRAGDPVVPSALQFDPQFGTPESPGTGEPVWATAAGLVRGADHFRNEGNLALWTYVTDATDAARPDALARRVTAIARYRVGNSEFRVVRFGTLIGEAERGLGQPDFDVSPPDRLVSIPVSEDRACFPQRIINNGNTDAYAIVLPEEAVPLADPRRDAWPSPLDARVYRDEGRPEGPLSTDEIVGSPHPKTDDVTTGASLDLLICYAVPDDYVPDDAASRQFELSVMFRSDLDEERSRVVDHTVEVERERALFLYPGTAEGEAVADRPWDGVEILGASSQPPAATLSGDPTAYVATIHAADGAEGNPAEIIWRYPFTEPRTIADSSVSLWANGAWDGRLSPPELRVQIGYAAGRGDEPTWGTVVAVTLDGDLAERSFVLPDGISFTAGDELYLRVGCADGLLLDPDDPPADVMEPSACNLAFGTSAEPSRVTVTFS